MPMPCRAAFALLVHAVSCIIIIVVARIVILVVFVAFVEIIGIEMVGGRRCRTRGGGGARSTIASAAHVHGSGSSSRAKCRLLARASMLVWCSHSNDVGIALVECRRVAAQ